MHACEIVLFLQISISPFTYIEKAVLIVQTNQKKTSRIYYKVCEENGIYLNECQELDFNDPDFENLIYKRRHGEDIWGEMSYNRFTEDELDYGDLNDIEDEE